MKLLQICVEGNTGSTGTIAESIGQFVIKKGWESYIAYGRFPRPSKSKLIHISTNLEILLHGLETRILDNHGFASRLATRRLIKKIEKINPDVVHLHHLHGYYINVEILFDFLQKSKIPVVWTFHDCWSFTGHCTYFDYVGCEKWKTECNQCPQKTEYPKSLFLDNSQNNFNLKKILFTSISNMTIVSVSEWLNNLVHQSFFKNTRHVCIYNGIDIELFKPINFSNKVKKKYLLENKYVILGVATTWDRRKGLIDFIELSKHLVEDEVIVLVGLSQNQMLDLPKNIVGLSRTDNRNELAHLFAASDVFLNLSTEETFGLTTAESIASGTPVVVYNKTASPELVDPATGYVVEKGNVKEIRDAINNIKNNTKKINYCVECRRYALKKFNALNTYNSYFELYKNIIKN